MLFANSHAAASLNFSLILGCNGSNAIWGLESSFFSSKSHHSSHGNTEIIVSPYNKKR